MDKPKIYINPPPIDRKCQRCGTHTSELKPFGKEGDPLVGDFDGAFLVKTFRSMDESANISEELVDLYNKILSEYELINSEFGDDNQKSLEEKYGVKEVDGAFFYDQLSSTVSASWECRDCIIQ